MLVYFMALLEDCMAITYVGTYIPRRGFIKEISSNPSGVVKRHVGKTMKLVCRGIEYRPIIQV
jgi:hypothetical protein